MTIKENTNRHVYAPLRSTDTCLVNSQSKQYEHFSFSPAPSRQLGFPSIHPANIIFIHSSQN